MTRQVWSNEIYEIEKVYKLSKVYGVYEYALNGLMINSKRKIIKS